MTLGACHRHPVEIRASVHSKGGRLTVAQIRFGDGSDAPATEVITVADLLSRHAPVPVPRQEPDTGGYAGRGLFAPDGPAAAPDSVVIDPAAARDPLDAGTPAPSNWVPVAFP